jgi:hypothetical protein
MQSVPCESKLLMLKKYLFERTRRESEFIILRIPMPEKWPFWFWTVTGTTIFFQ